MSIEELVPRVQRTQGGFADIEQAAGEVVGNHTTKESIRMARRLLTSEVHQARMLATLVLGRHAARSYESLDLLRTRVSKDKDWRVQEMLARAFDRYCAEIGYEQALPTLGDWLADPSPNVRRAATEGLRIWTSRPYFREHPEVAIQLLSQLRDDESEYVRKSVGNALRDISRKYRELVRIEMQSWDVSRNGIAQTHALASKFL